MGRICPCCIALLLFLGSSVSVAQQSLPPDKFRGLDLVRLTDGNSLVGFALGQDDSGKVEFAALRSWLEEHRPDALRKQVEIERDAIKHVRTVLIDRAKKWRSERSDDRRLVNFLNEQIAELEARPNKPAGGSLFTVYQLSAPEIRRLKIAPAKNRKIAGLAIQNGLRDVPYRSTVLLSRELEQRGIEIENQQVDLQGEVPRVALESIKQWRARQALLEYHYREPLDYQGTGTKFYKTGDAPSPLALMQDLGGANSFAQLGAELGLPEFKQFERKQESDWWHSTCERAEDAGFRGVAMTRLGNLRDTSSAKVSQHFFARLEPGKWFEVFRAESIFKTADVTEDQLKRLRQDPQVEKIEQVAGSLGLPLGDRLDAALRKGVATELALSRASAEFQHFLARYLDRIDEPKMPEVTSGLP